MRILGVSCKLLESEEENRTEKATGQNFRLLDYFSEFTTNNCFAKNELSTNL